MQTSQVCTVTVSFHIFTFNHAFIHFYFMFYNDSFYELIAVFSTEEKQQNNDSNRYINNNGFINIYPSIFIVLFD